MGRPVGRGSGAPPAIARPHACSAGRRPAPLRARQRLECTAGAHRSAGPGQRHARQDSAGHRRAEHRGRVGTVDRHRRDVPPLHRARNQPTVRVKLDAGAWNGALQQALDAVPVPPNAQPAAGPDGHLTVWQPSTDRMWELFQARRMADGWHASYGGAMVERRRVRPATTTRHLGRASRSPHGAPPRPACRSSPARS